MISLLIEIWTVGINKILGAFDVGTLEGWNLINVHESTIKDGDGDALAAIANIMQTMAV